MGGLQLSSKKSHTDTIGRQETSITKGKNKKAKLKAAKSIKTPNKTKKTKSGFKFWNLFTWG